MQWLINEFKAYKQELTTKLDSAIEKWAKDQIEAAEEVKKLKGEISALKARMGKKPE